MQVPVLLQLDGVVTLVSSEAAELAGGDGQHVADVQWRVGDIGARMTISDPTLLLAMPPAMRPFSSRVGHADTIVEAMWGDTAAIPSGPLVFDSGGVWTLTRTGDALQFHFRSPKFGAAPYKVARFQSDFSRGEVVLNRSAFDPATPVYPLEFPLDELLFVHLLAERDGVELHGCGVVDRGAGLLFIGQSGAGKSTLARLWEAQPGATVLSDDRIIVRRRGRKLMMYGTPWHGDVALISPGPVELTRLFVLRQASECGVHPLSGSEAAARLFSCCFAPFYDRDALAETLRILDLITRRTSCAELLLRPDPATIDYLRALA